MHSDDGLDELSISSNTHVIEVKGISIKEYDLNADDFGFPKAYLSDVRGGDSLGNTNLTYEVLSGTINGPKLDSVLLIAGKSTSIIDGIFRAKDALKEGKAMTLLNKISGLICM